MNGLHRSPRLTTMSWQRNHHLCGVVLATSLLASCNFAVHRNRSWAANSWTSDEPADVRREVLVDCSTAATTVSCDLRVHAAAGELLLRLVDPAGVIRHRQVVCAGATEVRVVWPPQVGTWRMAIEPHAFAGSYSVELSAGDVPIVVQVQLAEGPWR